jgi:hypothetical protein
MQSQHAGAADHAPLLHWDGQALAFVADKVAQAVARWRADWSPAAAIPDSTAGRALAAAHVGGAGKQPCPALRLHAGAWLAHEGARPGERISQPAQLVGRQVFGAGARVEPGSIAAELAQEALAQLAAVLRIVLAAGSDADGFDLASAAGFLPQDEFREWSGGVRVALPGFDGLALYLTGATVARLNPPKRAVAAARKPPLVPLTDAAGKARMALQARLQPVELTLGQIRTLQLGDVVVLPHALDQPLQVRTGTGSLLCEAYLGRQGAHRSLELLPAPGRAAAP